MQVDVKVDSTELLRRLRNPDRRLAYAVANALNATAKEVQAAGHQHVRSELLVKQPTFFFGTPGRPGGAAGRIRRFASVKQGRPFAEIEMSAPEGRGSSRRRALLPYWETGGERPHTHGSRRFAIPITGSPARPSSTESVPKEYHIQSLGLHAYRGGRRITRKRRGGKTAVQSLFGTEGRYSIPGASGDLQWKGKQRTFMLLETRNLEAGGIFQRYGRGDQIRLLYKFQFRVQIEDMLDWVPRGVRVAEKQLPEHMERETIKAIARDGGRSL